MQTTAAGRGMMLQRVVQPNIGLYSRWNRHSVVHARPSNGWVAHQQPGPGPFTMPSLTGGLFPAVPRAAGRWCQPARRHSPHKTSTSRWVYFVATFRFFKSVGALPTTPSLWCLQDGSASVLKKLGVAAVGVLGAGLLVCSSACAAEALAECAATPQVGIEGDV